jgi:hypothetical protein
MSYFFNIFLPESLTKIMKTKNLLLALGSIFLFSLGCTNEVGNEQPIPDSTLKSQSDLDETSNEQPNSDESDTNRNLQDTNWKLAGIVDVQTHESIELEPQECNTCYTLEFDSDTTAIGRSIANVMHFIVTRSNITMIMTTEIWDGENNNVNLFYEALLTLDTYEYSKDELKIYYDEKNKYLFYKPLLK